MQSATDIYCRTHRYPDEEAAALAADEGASRLLGPRAQVELVYPAGKKYVQCLSDIMTTSGHGQKIVAGRYLSQGDNS